MQLSPNRGNVYKNQNPDHMHTLNICTNIQQSGNFQGFCRRLCRISLYPLLYKLKVGQTDGYGAKQVPELSAAGYNNLKNFQ